MNKDQILCEMSNRTSEIHEQVQNVKSESENKQAENGLQHKTINIASVVEELPVAPTFVISSASEINSNKSEPNPSLSNNNSLPEEQPTVTVKEEELKPCSVVLQRSQVKYMFMTLPS
jgi:hypothetical protein